ncbi:MAG: Flp pilus assembly protein CpaB [Rhizobiaceae bacterium]
MNRRAITMIGIAAVFGAVAIFVADVWLKNQANARSQEVVREVKIEPAAPVVEFKHIVVANAPLRFGQEIDRAMLTEIPWPQESLPAGAFGSIDALMGEGSRVVLSPIEPNEPVLLAKLSGPNGRATLSNLLAPGMRAVTIKTDEIAGVGGFVAPGDRVDVVLTRDAGEIQEVAKNAEGATGSSIATEIVVENAKVLTVGQGADERQTGPQIVSSVTIEVTTEGARKVALARNVGVLSLSLRAAGGDGTSGAGLTTISSFGGSVAEPVPSVTNEEVSSIAPPASVEPPQLKTVIVTRGLEPQTYEVISAQGNGDR